MAGGAVTVLEQLVGQHEALAHGIVVAGGLTLMGRKAKLAIANSANPELPEERFSLKFVFESIASFVMGLGDSMMGKHNRKYLPFCAAIFTYIFFCNLIGLIPGFSAPTDSVPFNLGIAMVVFVMYNVWGIKEVGFKTYSQHFIGPVWWLAPLFIIIEPISHLARPLSLSLRLFGNMTADHAVLDVFLNLTKLVVPVLFYISGALICGLQAFIFMVLTMIYINLAIADDH